MHLLCLFLKWALPKNWQLYIIILFSQCFKKRYKISHFAEFYNILFYLKLTSSLVSPKVRLFGIFYKHCVYCINYYMKFNVFIFYSTQNAFGSNEADAYIRIIQLLSRAQIASLTFNSKKINYQSFFNPSDSDRKNSKKKEK